MFSWKVESVFATKLIASAPDPQIFVTDPPDPRHCQSQYGVKIWAAGSGSGSRCQKKNNYTLKILLSYSKKHLRSLRIRWMNKIQIWHPLATVCLSRWFSGQRIHGSERVHTVIGTYISFIYGRDPGERWTHICRRFPEGSTLHTALWHEVIISSNPWLSRQGISALNESLHLSMLPFYSFRHGTCMISLFACLRLQFGIFFNCCSQCCGSVIPVLFWPLDPR